MSAKGLIFNIVKGSFVDGYGIRTTIFLKGCPLRCVWCCNPEGQSFQPEIRLLSEKCNGCERCISHCHLNALELRNGIVEINRSLCDACGECIDYCYTGALEPFGTWYTAEEILDIVKKDSSYYDATGGGLTVGGGEATAHPEFLHELIDLCHAEGISVAIDTCGYTTTPEGFDALAKADLLLYDIKGLDDVAHQRNTGKSNKLILDNLKKLNDLRKSIIVRIPIIPGYNCDDDELEKIADLLSTLPSVERVDLLPMHEFGKMKYDQIGKDYSLVAHEVSEERIQKIIDMFESKGLKTQSGG
ncbi:MAG: glycyl-radical enzyme activating protein [Lachnospiraceae bacterium]|jgi:glycyl-radical enzyme activating protein